MTTNYSTLKLDFNNQILKNQHIIEDRTWRLAQELYNADPKNFGLDKKIIRYNPILEYYSPISLEEKQKLTDVGNPLGSLSNNDQAQVLASNKEDKNILDLNLNAIALNLDFVEEFTTSLDNKDDSGFTKVRVCISNDNLYIAFMPNDCNQGPSLKNMLGINNQEIHELINDIKNRLNKNNLKQLIQLTQEHTNLESNLKILFPGEDQDTIKLRTRLMELNTKYVSYTQKLNEELYSGRQIENILNKLNRILDNDVLRDKIKKVKNIKIIAGGHYAEIGADLAKLICKDDFMIKLKDKVKFLQDKNIIYSSFNGVFTDILDPKIKQQMKNLITYVSHDVFGLIEAANSTEANKKFLKAKNKQIDQKQAENKKIYTVLVDSRANINKTLLSSFSDIDELLKNNKSYYLSLDSKVSKLKIKLLNDLSSDVNISEILNQTDKSDQRFDLNNVYMKIPAWRQMMYYVCCISIVCALPAAMIYVTVDMKSG